MDANDRGSSEKPLTLQEIREQKRLIKAQLELHQLQRARRVLEASTNADYWLSSYVDLLDRYRDGDRLGYPISQPTDRRYGQNWPFWNTETQLSLFRAQARYLCSTNSYAIGLLGGLQAYVIGDGFQYRVVSKEKHGGKPSSLIPQVQAIVDEFCEVNQWWDWEQELFWRSREDGEYFLRYYPDAELQCLTVRSVEPEQVCTTGIPDGAAGEWSFGILTDPEDVQEIYAYNVLYLASPAEHSTDIREEVPVEDLQHFKINVRRTIKRGLTDFCYSTYDALHLAEKLRNNMAEGAAVQAALAYIRQHESATQAQVQNFLNTQQLDFSRTNPLTGLSINYKHLEPGSVVDIPRGMQYVQPPGAGNASGFIEILHASLRGAGCRWNAPEWLATASGGDMAAYTASLTAHAPFVRTATQKQKSYKQAYTRVIKEAIQVAIDYGRLPPETLDIIDIQCEAPSIPAKSELDEAQANKIRVQGGWKSRQTVQQEEGLDPQRELQNIEDYNRRMGTGEKPSSGPVHEANFNPNEPRDERGRWTKGNDVAMADDETWKEFVPKGQPSQVTAFAQHFEPPAQDRTNEPRPVVMPDGSVRMVRPSPHMSKEIEDYYRRGREHAGRPGTVHEPDLHWQGPRPEDPCVIRGKPPETLWEQMQKQLQRLDAWITKPPPPEDQNGETAYLMGLAVGIYEFGRDSLIGLLKLPAALLHPRELMANFQELAGHIRDGLKNADLKELQKIDPDLYRLVDLAQYNALSDYEKARLTARVVLKYATLVEGAAGAGKLGVRLGRKVAGEVEGLAGKIVGQVKKDILAKTEAPPLGRAKTPKASPGLEVEKSLVNQAKGAESHLGDVPSGKTVATTGKGERAVSGWSKRPGFVDGEAATNEVMKLSEEMGYPSRPAGFLDRGLPGRYNASHAEKQMAVLRPNEAISVSRPMCDECIAWFQKLARYREQAQVVADPKWVRIFRPDGTIVEIPR
jgi:hypothetical protein